MCPHCRFVFRVPKELDGRGVICPGCTRALKIPTPDDSLPPLVVPLPPKPLEPSHKRKRRGSRGERTAEDKWDRRNAGAKRNEGGQMVWTLAAGGVLLALAMFSVFKALRGGSSPPVVQTTKLETPPPAVVTPASDQLSDEAFLAAAEPLARAFLTANTIDQILPLVRNPEDTRLKILSLHPDGKFDASGITQFNLTYDVVRQGSAFSVVITTANQHEQDMTFIDTADGLKIDWESWVRWSELPWQEFVSNKPEQDTMFRVLLSEVDYYNFGFTDELKWRSYLLVSADGEQSLYGYVERQSPLDNRLRLPPDITQAPYTLKLKFPSNEIDSRNQVLITEWLADGWVLDTEPEP